MVRFWKKWIQYLSLLIEPFSKDILQTASTRNIILAMISLNTKAQNAAKETSEVIFKKIMDKVDLNHYQNIELITHRSGSNEITNKAINLLGWKIFDIQNSFSNSL